MTSIYTVIPDIYSYVQKEGWQNEIQAHYRVRLGKAQGKSRLRLSRLGPTCPRAFWYSIHSPELAELLPPWAEIKYSYGHLVEELAIQLTKATGHEVTGEQDELDVDGVLGHRDCVVDGCLVDIKSMSTRGIQKLKDKTLAQDDPFGYLDQLDGYSLGSLHDPLVRVKDRAYLIAIDKTLGHMVLYEHEARHENVRRRIEVLKRIASLLSPPICECGTRIEGSSGNVGLDVKASYSPYKYQCFPHLRTFLYADGPKYLTKVVREPNVTELRRAQ
jgi:hypothetical protein